MLASLSPMRRRKTKRPKIVEDDLDEEEDSSSNSSNVHVLDNPVREKVGKEGKVNGIFQ